MPAILNILLLALGAAAMPAPAAVATPAPAKVDTAAGSATTPYEAPRPSGALGIGFSDVEGGGALGGGGWITTGDFGGEAAGTLLYSSEYQAAGHLTGGLGDASAGFIGTINNGGFAKGCVYLGDGSDGISPCLELPVAAAQPTPAP